MLRWLVQFIWLYFLFIVFVYFRLLNFSLFSFMLCYHICWWNKVVYKVERGWVNRCSKSTDENETCIVFIQETDPKVVTAHSHVADSHAVSAEKARVFMKADATMTRNRPAQIIADTLMSSSPGTRVACGDKDNLRKMIRRHRRGALPKEPASTRVCNFINHKCNNLILHLQQQRGKWICRHCGTDNRRSVLCWCLCQTCYRDHVAQGQAKTKAAVT